jgi:hypothetical protein
VYKEELHNFQSSSDIIRMTRLSRMRWAGHVANIGHMRNAYRMLVWKPERKRPPGRNRRRWEYNKECILERQEGLLEIGFICLGIGTSGGIL